MGDFLKRIVFVISICMLLTACSGKDENYNVNKKIVEMKTYTARAEITVYGAKENSEYIVKQYYKADDKFRIETIKPEFLKGKIMVYSEKNCTIYHPLIDQTIKINGAEDENRFTNIGIIQKGVLAGEKVEYKAIKRDGREYIQVKCLISDGNKYRKYAILYLKKEGYIPEILELLDEKEKVVVLIKYSSFDYNCSVDDSLFKL